MNTESTTLASVDVNSEIERLLSFKTVTGIAEAETQLPALQVAEVIKLKIRDIAASTNKFSREEVTEYRALITKARKDHREYLKSMKSSDISNLIAKHMEEGFEVRKVQPGANMREEFVDFRICRKKGDKPAPKSIGEMSTEEIMAALGDKAEAVFKAMAMKAQAANA